jgi:hypothetical protein
MTRRPVRELRYVPGVGARWPEDLIAETTDAQVEAQVEAELADRRGDLEPIETPPPAVAADLEPPIDPSDQTPAPDADEPAEDAGTQTKRRRRGDESQEG